MPTLKANPKANLTDRLTYNSLNQPTTVVFVIVVTITTPLSLPGMNPTTRLVVASKNKGCCRLVLTVIMVMVVIPIVDVIALVGMTPPTFHKGIQQH